MSLSCLTAADDRNGNGNGQLPNGKSGETLLGNAKGNGKGGSGPTNISYHGGPVMTGTTNMYYIWYGDWSGNTATTILSDFAKGIGGSPYFNINTTYYDGSGTKVSNNVALGGSTTDYYSQGANLTDAGVKAVVAKSLGSNLGDPHGVYFVLTSADVNETSGFCTQYCGWHTHGSISGADIKYSFVGDAARCLSGCAAQSTSPNGNPGVDGMISVIAHELEEAATDPDLNAWYFATGAENADQCAWTFGTEYTAGNGSKANMKLGTRDYLVQQNWIQSSAGKCALHL
ncbi:MAG TPA: hypothetical protein VL285_16940 [Bryobacteraceae bacterium]|nr:hypothetical protein [Bryobacteraceae bacterium]